METSIFTSDFLELRKLILQMYANKKTTPKPEMPGLLQM